MMTSLIDHKHLVGLFKNGTSTPYGDFRYSPHVDYVGLFCVLYDHEGKPHIVSKTHPRASTEYTSPYPSVESTAVYICHFALQSSDVGDIYGDWRTPRAALSVQLNLGFPTRIAEVEPYIFAPDWGFICNLSELRE